MKNIHRLFHLLCAVVTIAFIAGCGEKIADSKAVPEKLISGLKDLHGKKVASLTGSCFVEKARQAAPDVELIPVYFNDNISSVQALLDGKVEAVFLEKPIVDLWCKSYPGLYDAGVYGDDFYAFALKKNSPLTGKINQVIQQLEKSGDLDAFKEKWCSSIDPDRKIQLWKHKKDYDGSNGILRFGTDPSQEPMAFILNGQYAGVDIEVINRVAYELNMKLEIVSMKFNDLIPALQENKLDCAGAAMSVTEKRKEIIDFTNIYCKGTYTILAKKPDGKSEKKYDVISELADLDGKIAASQHGSTFEEKASSIAPNVKIKHIYFSDNASSVNALINGKADAVLLDEPVARFWCARYPEKLYFAGVYANDTYSFALKKGSPLKNRINNIIRQLKNSGDLDKFKKKWCESDSINKELEKWQHKKDYNGSAGTLRYATNLSQEPMAFFNSNGKYAGMDIEVINRIAYELNMKLEIINIDFSSLICALTADRADIVGGTLSVTPARQKAVDFVTPYYIGGYTILARKNK